MINNIAKFIDDCEQNLSQKFKEVNEIALFNQKKVLEAFRKNNISQRHFIPTTGYGYDDEGRLALSKIFSEIFHTENAIVSPLIASGTAALSAALFGILRPEDYLYSISGKPYDTLSEVISGTSNGSLKDFKINYLETDIKIENENIDFDYKEIEKNLKKHFIKLVFIGRSRGYEWREAVSLKLIENAVKFIKSISPKTIIMVDNCYGEFVERKEPSDCGVDLIVGSLNKNPGGGLAPTGGYIAGKDNLIKLVAGRITAPSIGMEVGSYAFGYTQILQGLFIAPHVVSGAIKSALLFGEVFEKLGYETLPKKNCQDFDMIRSIKLNDEKLLIDFCKTVQKFSPIDSNLSPEPWDMPGYSDKVIMAAGTFIQGASIELSADAPVREPYIVHIQGALTYEHAKIVIEEILKYLI